GDRLDIDDGELVVKREADRHVVHELAGLDRSAPFVGMLVALLVGDAALDVPQAVLAEKALAGDATRVQMLSPNRRRKRHGRTSWLILCGGLYGRRRYDAQLGDARALALQNFEADSVKCIGLATLR